MPRTDSDLDFENPHEYSLNTPTHMAVFGTNGSGKTTLAAKTAADAGMRVVLLDCSDAGAVTLRKVDPKFLRIIRIKSTDHYLEVMEKLIRMADDIDLLVPDTITGLQSLAIRQVKGKKGEMNQRKWGQVGSKIIECLAETRNFPKEVVYLVQEKTKSGGEDSEDKTGPGLTPSTKGYLSSVVDWVGRLYVRSNDEGVVQRVMDFRITDSLEVKDRAGIFPKLIINPTYPAIRKKIQTTLQGEPNAESK